MKLEIKAIDNAKTSIGRRDKGLKEKWKSIAKDLPISRLATIEKRINSTLATTNENKH